jgi:hypothetical protein
MSKLRFYIDTEGNDEEAYKEAIKYACQLSKDNNEIKRIIFYTHTKQTTGWFDRIFGRENVKKLFNGVQIENCKPPLKIETKIQYKDYAFSSDIVIVCAMKNEDLFRIDDYNSVKAIIAIPWLGQEIEKWLLKWRPIELKTNKQFTSRENEMNLPCIIRQAMTELSSILSFTNDISHKLDIEKVVIYIQTLHRNGEILDADMIENYLISELKVNFGKSKYIKDVIVKVNNGKSFRNISFLGYENLYERWKNNCE